MDPEEQAARWTSGSLVHRNVFWIWVLIAPLLPGQVAFSQEEKDSLTDRASRAFFEAHAHLQAGDLPAAFARYQEAVPLLEEVGDSEYLFHCCSNASVVATNLGKYQDALDLAARAVTASKSLSKDSQAKALTNHGLACRYLGHHQKALDSYKASLNLNQELGDFMSIARNYSNIAVIHLLTGKYAAGMEACQAAIQLCMKNTSAPWSAPNRRLALTNLASILEMSGQTEEAFKLSEELLAEENLTKGEEAHFRTNIGRIHLKLGDPQKALEAFSIAAESFQSLQDIGSFSNALQHTGVTHCNRFSDHETAQSILSQALELSTKIEDRNERLYDLLFLGRCKLHTEDVPGAETHFSEALSLANEIESSEGRWISLSSLAECAVRKGELDQARQLISDCISQLEDLRETHVPSEYRASYFGEAGFFWDKVDVYALAIEVALDRFRDSPSVDQIARAFGLFEKARARALLARLGGSPLTLDEVQSRVLSPEEILIQLIPRNRGWIGLVITTNSASAHTIPSTPALEEAITRAQGPPDQLTPSSQRIAMKTLGTQVFDPLFTAAPSGKQSLILALDNQLANLPVALLPNPGNSRPNSTILESFRLSQVPSASILGAIRKRNQKPETRPVAFSAFANPVLPKTAQDQSYRPSVGSPLELLVQKFRLRPLPNSEDEVRRIAGQMDNLETRLYVGASATPARLRIAAQEGAKVLHLASHSVFDSTLKDACALILSPDLDDQASDALWVRDIRELECNVDFVALSACRSALGRSVRGEGASSLAQTFVGSGAHCVLSTVFSVDDAVSPEIMDLFYQKVISGLSVSEALRQTQLVLLETPGFQPGHWGAYVIFGDGQIRLFDPPSFPPRLLLSLAVGMSVALLALCTLLLRRRLRSARSKP